MRTIPFVSNRIVNELVFYETYLKLFSKKAAFKFYGGI